MRTPEVDNAAWELCDSSRCFLLVPHDQQHCRTAFVAHQHLPPVVVQAADVGRACSLTCPTLHGPCALCLRVWTASERRREDIEAVARWRPAVVAGRALQFGWSWSLLAPVEVASALACPMCLLCRRPQLALYYDFGQFSQRQVH